MIKGYHNNTWIFGKVKNHSYSTKKVQPGDIWLALYPYELPNNKIPYGKPRPVMIKEIHEEELVVRMITSNSKKGKLIDDSYHFDRPSYLTNKEAIITKEKLIRRIRSVHDKRRNKGEKHGNN